jgi:hypothetical protein
MNNKNPDSPPIYIDHHLTMDKEERIKEPPFPPLADS